MLSIWRPTFCIHCLDTVSWRWLQIHLSTVGYPHVGDIGGKCALFTTSLQQTAGFKPILFAEIACHEVLYEACFVMTFTCPVRVMPSYQVPHRLLPNMVPVPVTLYNEGFWCVPKSRLCAVPAISWNRVGKLLYIFFFCENKEVSKSAPLPTTDTRQCLWWRESCVKIVWL